MTRPNTDGVGRRMSEGGCRRRNVRVRRRWLNIVGKFGGYLDFGNNLSVGALMPGDKLEMKVAVSKVVLWLSVLHEMVSEVTNLLRRVPNVTTTLFFSRVAKCQVTQLVTLMEYLVTNSEVDYSRE